jgi:hypothetical protein
MGVGVTKEALKTRRRYFSIRHSAALASEGAFGRSQCDRVADHPEDIRAEKNILVLE